MPFGLTNALATFQQLMNTILAPYLRKFVLVFFDNILIYNRNLKEHLEHLQLVLDALHSNQLYAKLSKCTFAQPQVEYLGHVIRGDGVATGPTKIEAIVQWPTPENVTHLRSFLGLTGYYRRFIQNYGYICKPLFQSLNKDNFKWEHEQMDAFNTLKNKMTQPPVLALPDFFPTLHLRNRCLCLCHWGCAYAGSQTSLLLKQNYWPQSSCYVHL